MRAAFALACALACALPTLACDPADPIPAPVGSPCGPDAPCEDGAACAPTESECFALCGDADVDGLCLERVLGDGGATIEYIIR